MNLSPRLLIHPSHPIPFHPIRFYITETNTDRDMYVWAYIFKPKNRRKIKRFFLFFKKQTNKKLDKNQLTPLNSLSLSL